METAASRLQFKTLYRADDAVEYALYKAALEWNLIDPIVIERREDLKSEYRWHDRLEPYHHQVTNLITYCRRLPVTLLADDVGLGKTISAGLVASELMARGRVSKILVVCPKILRPQWQEELDQKFDIPSVIATGQELIEAQPPGDTGAVITTYHSARSYLDQLEDGRFEMLILDEAHKLRNLYGVQNPPQVAVRFRKALADRSFKYVLMLTATPIQNRLWDLYSLVDLLTVARGHENPFGSEEGFAKKFLDDPPTQARRLKPSKKDEFRSIVYGYMSRIRRGDANLHFPDRKVQLHSVQPSAKELDLISVIAKPIQKLPILAQISILQALISSPEALVKMLKGMAEKGTAPQSMADDVQGVAAGITVTSKLAGLAILVDRLRAEQPDRWRVLVFTRWRETQLAIYSCLEEKGISCGLIHGDSGKKNQETLSKFRKEKPEINVIISTEAGSEGINLQSANVLVNYDLPWNPMIVEQRIGRIQRLSSNFAEVFIFNIILKGTFEEYIVGRLMEKLQMAAHAIGDIEALLEASGMDEEKDDGTISFEDHIRKLVLASLAGKDVEKATKLAEKSILGAKDELEHEEKNMNDLFGKMDSGSVGPACPKLPTPERSMDIKTFALAALEYLGAEVIPQPTGLYLSTLDGRRELIRFDNDGQVEATASVLYAPGTPAFDRLVARIAKRPLHLVVDGDHEGSEKVVISAGNWVAGFGGKVRDLKTEDVRRCFDGAALVRVRATVAHDSYERLLHLRCDSKRHSKIVGMKGEERLREPIDDPESIGIVSQALLDEADLDEGINAFCSFYDERKTEELKATGNDSRKKVKLTDDFTPRLDVSLSGVEGTVKRIARIRASYLLDADAEYSSELGIAVSSGDIIESPDIGKCEVTQKLVPSDCLKRCEVSGQMALRHLLVKSDLSGRSALPEHSAICAVSGKRILVDEGTRSDVTGELATTSLLRTSAVTRKRAEPRLFGKCEFTGVDALEDELVVSQVSGKRFRSDESMRSIVSGKPGHKSEFIECLETHQPLLASEAEKCEVTGKLVVPGLLQACELSQKMVLPSELERCAASKKRALHRFFVSSSLSGARILEEVAVASLSGEYCAPQEAKSCMWSGRKIHPDDMRNCNLTGVPVSVEYLISPKDQRLEPLVLLLNGVERVFDQSGLWETIGKTGSTLLGSKRCTVEAARLAPDKRHLAVVMKVQSWLGLKVEEAGMIYSVPEKTAVGRATIGKRGKTGWVQS